MNLKLSNRDQTHGSKPSKLSSGCAVLFFVPFFAMGWGFLFFIVIQPIYRSVRAASWTPTPCIILVSDVEMQSGDDGPTYKVHIEYEYVINSVGYRSDRYEFFPVSTSGRSGKEKDAHQYPVGSAATCYVNPDNPDDAVLYRGLSWGLLFGLIPLLFAAIGTGGIYYGIKHWNEPVTPWSNAGTIRSGNYLPRWKSTGGEPVTLKPAWSRFGRVAGVTFAALFWNGIVSVFIYHAVESFRKDDPEWFLTFFLIPFVIIGLGLIGGIVHQLLGLANPRLILTVNNDALRPGDTLDVGWDMLGRNAKLQSLTIHLEGKEAATYRHGKNTRTESDVFMDLPVMTSRDANEIAGGTASVTIPAGLMHSLKAGNTEIIWTLKAKGEIPRWPDVSEAYPIVILPPDYKANAHLS